MGPQNTRVCIHSRGILINSGPHTLDTLEPHFAANHLGHFAFARALHRALAAADGARIVVVSSSAHLFSPVVFDDIHFWLAMPGGPVTVRSKPHTVCLGRRRWP